MNGASFEGKRIERNLMDSYARRYVVVHGTWYRIHPHLNKKQRRAARRKVAVK